MSVRNDISGLLGYISREAVWRERLQDVVAEHLMPALEEFEVDQDELADLLGKQWSGVLWGCGFEDLLGQQYEDGNIVDLYLKRRGWKETALNRAYFAALRDTPVSLYEVSDVQPGTSMVLRDLLGDSEPITVHEQSATRSLTQWARIAVRVVAEDDHHVISGALLPFSAEAADLLFAGLRDALRLKKRDVLRLTRDQLLSCAPIFTSAWLFTELPRVLIPTQPELCNSDGDEMMFHDLHFPLAASVTQKDVAGRLDRVKGLFPEGPRLWHWLAQKKALGSKAAGGIKLATETGNGTVLGSLELKGKVLLVSVNSAVRAAKIEAMVLEAAGEFLKPPLTTIRTVEQVMAEERPREGADEIPPEIARQILREHMDRHYRDTLDQPIPALGGKTPRQAVRSAAGRKKAIEWLKLIENRSAGHPDASLSDYDFKWMWGELGIAEHRP